MARNSIASAVIAFRDKPESCSKCVAKKYCEKKKLKTCPIKPLPNAGWSGIGDEYCAGWDNAVVSMLWELKTEKYNYIIPVKDKRSCDACKAGRKRKPCPFFPIEGEFSCYTVKYFRNLCKSFTYENPVPADYEIGHNDGVEWVEDELNISEE